MTQEANAWLGINDAVAVVTGAGSGIGAEAARALAAAGASVALLDLNGESAAAVAAEIARTGGRAVGWQVDVANVDAVCSVADQIEATLGACDILVNNAAIVGYVGPLLDAQFELWNRMLSVNLTGALACAQAFGRQMVRRGNGGSIINVTSICGHMPLPGGGAYSVSKAGLMMLTRLLALELSGHGIRCNSVAPGLVNTPATARAYEDPQVAEARRKMVPLGRVSSPPDLADVIVFLASKRAAYIAGQDILVDGAMSQTLMSMVPKPATGMAAR